ncbi:growth hormone secretagogue receptor type 1-like [Brachionichthys hirsutus]|uniref:growth hormone secretagogue receptor type 1-like n=1 Tax=Brachionichthys hirsutus TaxID=412623 RepID=UPI0036047D4C
MDFLELGGISGGCEDENCTLTSAPLESCLNQECQWEEQVFGRIELVLVTVIYIPLMLFGLLGNTLTILVVWLRPDMRSSTYLYLSSMAVSDLLILLLLPLDLYKLWKPVPWPLGDLACKVTMFLAECCTFCTILHITFLSLERYLAVCWPITAKTLVTRVRTKAVIGCLWLGAAISAAPVLVMFGVEEVGGEEQGVGEWMEGGGWTAREGEQVRFMIGERGYEHVNLKNVGLEGIQWEEEKRGWAEMDREIKMGIREGEERKQEDGTKTRQMDNHREENNMREDEDESHRGEMDRRECRCSDYAVSSGLLKAMMILSNLYFLVPLCILGLVYSLIGRTLCLRPQSSRKDQSHRQTIKMLGVIVLAFVLCWLPFHVGRTIFSLSLGTDQETNTDPNLHLNTRSNFDGQEGVTEIIEDEDIRIERGMGQGHRRGTTDTWDGSSSGL